MTAEKKVVRKKGFIPGGKSNTPPCRACYRPCEDKDAIYCAECIASEAYKWHLAMLAKWQAELAAKEEGA